MRCRHVPGCPGRRITAVWDGKNNWPDKDAMVIVSTGSEAVCVKCGKALIIHDPRLKMACWYSELENVA